MLNHSPILSLVESHKDRPSSTSTCSSWVMSLASIESQSIAMLMTQLYLRLDPTSSTLSSDPHLSFATHIHHLSLRDAKKLVHTFVSSRLDYCNALVFRIPGGSLRRLQHIQNSAAGILMRVRKYEHITPILQILHWLPIHLCIEYNLCVLTHQCIHGNAPLYLKEFLTPQSITKHLHLTNTHRLCPPGLNSILWGIEVS